MEQIIGHVRAVRSAAAFQAGDAESIQSLAKLEEETRLADARFARDPDDLAEAVPRPVEAFQQKPQLEVPAQEGAQPAPAKPETRRLRPRQLEALMLRHASRPGRRVEH